MPQIAYYNGAYMPKNEIHIDLEDRGFQFGDGVYEVMRCMRGQAVALYRHIRRLQRSAAAIEIPLPLATDELADVIRQLIRRNEMRGDLVYLQLTRGVSLRAHQFPANTKPTFLAYPLPWQEISPEQFEKGGAAIIVRDERWLRCDIKSLNLLPNVMAKEKAHRAGVAEALFERDGHGVLEGSSSNLFIVRDGTLITPPATSYILPGITREILLELAQKAGIPVQLREIPREELLSADEVFITNRGVEVFPLVRIENHPIGNSKPGPVTRQLHEAYSTLVAAADDLEKI